MELYIFARFHASPGHDKTVGEALTECMVSTRAEAGCLSGQVFRSLRDPRLYYVHSRWTDEAAFERHPEEPPPARPPPLAPGGLAATSARSGRPRPPAARPWRR